MLISLKAIKISVSAIEKELGFSNGLIGKAAKGIAELSDEKMEMLRKYFNEKIPASKPIEKQVVVTPKGEVKSVPSKKAISSMNDVMEKMNKRFGAGTVMTFGDRPDTKYDTISTGSFGLDRALGIGGLPRGRMVEIFGWESSGKTTISLNCIADAQRQGLKCLLIDAEAAFDPEYAKQLGVNVDTLNYCQPSCGEDALEVADTYIRSGEIGLVVIDSVAALVPKAELAGEMGDSKMGLHARLMSQACRKLVNLVADTNTLVIFINQLRLKIGMVFGNPEVTTGGMALQFYASVRMQVSRSLAKESFIVNENNEREGNLTTVKVIKNKTSPPFTTATFNIMYGFGIDRVQEVVVAAVKANIIEKKGSHYSYKTTPLGQGLKQVQEFLESNPELATEIESKIP